jgi:hypothetical protein
VLKLGLEGGRDFMEEVIYVKMPNSFVVFLQHERSQRRKHATKNHQQQPKPPLRSTGSTNQKKKIR